MSAPSAIPSLSRLAVLLALLGTLVAVDLGSDLDEGVTLVHTLVEGGAVLLAAMGLWSVVLDIRAERARLADELTTLRARGEDLRAEAARWRAEAEGAARGFAEAVEREFERWSLTEAEREIALLLLKGMSLKEIAEARGTAERTVRQQATSVYAKSGLGGRSELASYFLDALQLPRTPRDTGRPASAR